jgi:hypothetical protein
MTRVRVESFTISLDGYGAGPDQDLTNPLGVGGTDLHQWLLPTRTVQQTLFGADGGSTGIDDDFAARGFKNVGAWILGRKCSAPFAGPGPIWTGKAGGGTTRHLAGAAGRGRVAVRGDGHARSGIRMHSVRCVGEGHPCRIAAASERSNLSQWAHGRPVRHPRRFRASPHSGPARREAVMRVRCYGDRRRC